MFDLPDALSLSSKYLLFQESIVTKTLHRYRKYTGKTPTIEDLDAWQHNLVTDIIIIFKKVENGCDRGDLIVKLETSSDVEDRNHS